MRVTCLILTCCAVASAQSVTGELKQWHDVTLTFDGPSSSESADPNPFFDYRLNVTFTTGSAKYVVPGYFAADGNAAETSAKRGNKWRVHFVPDETGAWNYSVSFRAGPEVAASLDPNEGRAVAPHGTTGTLSIASSDKTDRDHRGQGLLAYAGEHYARYRGSGKYFIQAGAQSPENFLAYAGFDDTVDHGGAGNRLRDGLHHYEPHIKDWKPGDPVWKGDRGKGIIGALNYLAGKGMNTFYTVTMNVDGDGREIYPWTSYEERARYDVSKLAQWEIVMSHMDKLGLQLMLITQEEENEQILGKMTSLRKVYYRELIARFAHHHALLWDLSEEMDRWRYYKTQDIKDICEYIKALDPWKHPIQYVQWKGELLPDDKGYGRLAGFPLFDGTAMQHDPENTHEQTRKWVDVSAKAGHKWLVGVIEINPTSSGVLPDADDYWHDVIRKKSIWGNLMAGGSGSVYFFGYKYPNSDLDMEDWRSRDHFWDLQRYAHEFFTNYLPFHQMRHADQLTSGTDDWVFAKPGEVYAIYLPEGGTAQLDLTEASGSFEVKWYDPRHGGSLQDGTVRSVASGGKRMLGEAPNQRAQDWAVLVRPATRAQTYLVKLSTPVNSKTSKVGDSIRAAMISPETLLNGYLEGELEKVSSTPGGALVLRFDRLVYKGEATLLQTELVDWVNSKGHKSVDDEERPVTLENGELRTTDSELWLDEGAELRVRLQ